MFLYKQILKISLVTPLFKAISKDPRAPNEADSVGVATPKRIEPSTNIIRRIGGKIVKNKLLKLVFSFKSFFNGKFLA